MNIAVGSRDGYGYGKGNVMVRYFRKGSFARLSCQSYHYYLRKMDLTIWTEGFFSDLIRLKNQYAREVRWFRRLNMNAHAAGRPTECELCVQVHACQISFRGYRTGIGIYPPLRCRGSRVSICTISRMHRADIPHWRLLNGRGGLV